MIAPSDAPGHPHRGRILAAVGFMVAVAVHLPALRALLLHDDYAQRAMADGGITPTRGALDLYDYIDDSDRASLLDRGALPWWTSPGLVLRFFRPLSSVLAWVDHWACDTCRATALVKAPFSCPKSTLSASDEGMVVQSTTTRGPPARELVR